MEELDFLLNKDNNIIDIDIMDISDFDEITNTQKDEIGLVFLVGDYSHPNGHEIIFTLSELKKIVKILEKQDSY